MTEKTPAPQTPGELELTRSDAGGNLARRLATLGAILFFAVATIFGMLEVHSSTDTWIGLAAARQIFELGHVPQNDTFSFTMHDQPWYNQNWLTHVIMYLEYDKLGPDGLAIGTWCTSAAIFFMTMLAAYFRSGSWLAAWIAGALVGVGSRDFLSPRPSTMGFFCIAALGLLINALEGQRREKPRWWPIVGLGLLLLLWGNAHGSFNLAYGIIGIYLACWAGMRLVRVGLVQITDQQAIVIALVAGAIFLVTLLCGPFGLANFIHPNKVLGSNEWRSVSEWRPPYDPAGSYPPMQRYWWIIGGLIVGLIALGNLALFAGEAEPTKLKNRALPGASKLPLRFFDIAVILIGFGFSIWARRFAPMLYIFAAPVVTQWTVAVLNRIRRSPRLNVLFGETGYWAVSSLMLALALGLGIHTYRRGVNELVDPFVNVPKLGLLDRVTRFDQVPDAAVEYLARNELDVRLFTEWTLAGIVMFKAPVAKVFIDGRAQQVYEIGTYHDYQRANMGQSAADITQVLNDYGVSALLVKQVPHPPGLVSTFEAAERSPEWIPILYARVNSPYVFGLFLRAGDPHLETLAQRIVEGKEWRPDTPEAWVTRAQILLRCKQPRKTAALEALLKALAAEPRYGVGDLGYAAVGQLMMELGRADAARRYFEQESTRLRSAAVNLSAKDRDSLLRSLGEAVRRLPAASAPAP